MFIAEREGNEPYPNSLYITLLRYTVLAFCSNLVAQH